MSRRVLLRSLGQCCLGLVVLLVAGGAAGMLPVSLKCPLPLRRTHPPTLVCCYCVFAAMGVTSTKSGRLEVNLSLSEKRGGKSHLGTILLSAVSGIWRFCCQTGKVQLVYSFLNHAGCVITTSGVFSFLFYSSGHLRMIQWHLGSVHA